MAVGAVVQGRAAPGGEHPASVVEHGVVHPCRAEAARRPIRPDDEPRTDAVGVGVRDHGGHRDGLLLGHRDGDLVELGKAHRIDPLDEHVEDPTAGQPDRKGVAVGDAVALQHRPGPGEHLPAQLVDRPLHAPAGDAAHGALVRGHQHGRAGRVGGGAERGHHRPHGGRLACPPGSHQLAEHLTHCGPPRATDSAWPGCGRPATGRRAAAQRRCRPAPARSRPVRHAD